jgi:hypothetical protein
LLLYPLDVDAQPLPAYGFCHNRNQHVLAEISGTNVNWPDQAQSFGSIGAFDNLIISILIIN